MLDPQAIQNIRVSNDLIFNQTHETARVFTETAISGNASQAALGIGRTPSYATGVIQIIPSWWHEGEVNMAGGQTLVGKVPIYTQITLDSEAIVQWNEDLYSVIEGPQRIKIGGKALYNRYILERSTTANSL